MSFLKKIFGQNEPAKPEETLKKMGLDLGEILEQAKAAQQAGQAQIEVHAQMQTIDVGALMNQVAGPAEPRTQFVKKTTCHNCGGANPGAKDRLRVLRLLREPHRL